MRHNQAVTDIHFRKDWKRHVHTWFKQPFRKQRRHTVRAQKAARAFPNPIKALRPTVRCCTQRYNFKTRLGRGFTLKELEQARIEPRLARTVGIAVDARRINKSQESVAENVARLQAYMARLVVLPRKAAKAERTAQVKKAAADKRAKRVAALNTVAGEHVKKIAELREKLEKAAAEYKKNADNAKAKEVKTVRKALVAEIKAYRAKKAELVAKHPEVYRRAVRLPVRAAKGKQIADPNKALAKCCCSCVEVSKLTKGMTEFNAHGVLKHNRAAAKAVGGMEKGKKTIAAKKEKAKK